MAEVISSLIAKAKHRVYVCSYLLLMPFLLVQIVKAKKRGCDVKVLVDSDDRNWKPMAYLRKNDIEVRIWKPWGRGKLHAKFIIADKKALVGSANITQDAMNNNFEIMILLTGETVEELTQIFLREFTFSELY